MFKACLMGDILTRQLYKAGDIRQLCVAFIHSNPPEHRNLLRQVRRGSHPRLQGSAGPSYRQSLSRRPEIPFLKPFQVSDAASGRKEWVIAAGRSARPAPATPIGARLLSLQHCPHRDR